MVKDILTIINIKHGLWFTILARGKHEQVYCVISIYRFKEPQFQLQKKKHLHTYYTQM